MKPSNTRLLSLLALATAATPVLPPVLGGAAAAFAQASQNPCAPGGAQNPCAPGGAQNPCAPGGTQKGTNGGGAKPAANPCAPS
ncbi:hypothetical protein [Acidocella sp.]|uniref:hypothetical protein n=1 Tax=Acidocella sp. TaxID=50710 RepID=UPI0026112466|nr:hypothetical protein [Acidocella sp.]